jgi:hypothetical protein
VDDKRVRVHLRVVKRHLLPASERFVEIIRNWREDKLSREMERKGPNSPILTIACLGQHDAREPLLRVAPSPFPQFSILSLDSASYIDASLSLTTSTLAPLRIPHIFLPCLGSLFRR